MAWIRKRPERVPYEARLCDPDGRERSRGFVHSELRSQLGERQVPKAPSGRRGRTEVA